MTTTTQNLENNKPMPILAKFDANKFANATKVELEPELACEFVPDKAGFEKGESHEGIYISTKEVVSDKITSSRLNADGKKYRNLHILADANGVRFGVWGTGILDALMKGVKANEAVRITYIGRADKPLKEKEAPPMLFDIVKI